MQGHSNQVPMTIVKSNSKTTPACMKLETSPKLFSANKT